MVLKINRTIIEYDAGNVRIVDSWKVETEVFMEYILKEFIKETGYESRRSIKSWIREWKAHNRLYRLGLFRSHTKDTDLEENEYWWRLVVYNIIGRF